MLNSSLLGKLLLLLLQLLNLLRQLRILQLDLDGSLRLQLHQLLPQLLLFLFLVHEQI